MQSLTEQQGLDGLEWELLLIDNNSSDATTYVAESFKDRLPLRYIFEGTQGLSAARNRALREFKGSLLVFTDDDVVLDTLWLSSFATAEHIFPEADFFGGRILPLWENCKPRWLVDPNLALISGLIVYYDHGVNNRWFDEAEPLPFGASFGLRRRLIEKLKPFRLDLGVNSGSSGRGEEAEYLERAKRSGSKSAYVGTAVCFHTQNPDRFRLTYLYQFGVEKGRAEVLMGRGVKPRRFASFILLLKGFRQLALGRGDRFRQCVINIGIQRGIANSQLSTGRSIKR